MNQCIFFFSVKSALHFLVYGCVCVCRFLNGHNTTWYNSETIWGYRISVFPIEAEKIDLNW